MQSDIGDRLTQVIEKRRMRDKLTQDLNQVERELGEKTRLLDDLEQQLKHEKVDVDKLERFSLTGLFYSVLGSKDQQVDKERQELLAAQLKYQQVKGVVDTLHADQMYMEQKLTDLREVDDEYKSLVDEKEAWLRQANPQAAGELINLSEQIANKRGEKREIDEAITAATGVLTSLDQVIDSLESAEGWGTWDLLGGGLLSTAVKHSRIDEARVAVQDVQAKLSRFTRELADVQRSTDLTIEIDGLDIFADYFFDGLIVDWIVQSKIQNSLEQARQVHGRIETAAKALGKLQAEALGQVQRLNDQRTGIIERS